MMAGSIFLYTLRVRNRGGAPAGGWRKFRRPPLHRRPTSGTLALQTSSLGRATFGRKRNICQISAPQPGNLGAPWTALTSRRKLLVRVGKAAAKISEARITAFELLAHLNHRKTKNSKFSPITLDICMAGEGCQNALYVMLVRFYGSNF